MKEWPSKDYTEWNWMVHYSKLTHSLWKSFLAKGWRLCKLGWKTDQFGTQSWLGSGWRWKRYQLFSILKSKVQNWHFHWKESSWESGIGPLRYWFLEQIGFMYWGKMNRRSNHSWMRKWMMSGYWPNWCHCWWTRQSWHWFGWIYWPWSSNQSRLPDCNHWFFQ